jgi:hypothetical protein
MKRNELLDELKAAHRARVLASGNGATVYSEAANEIQHLLVYIEQLKERLHGVNERLLNAQTDIQLLEARARRND